MYRDHLRAATSAWPSTMELRKYRRTFSWMWGQVTQNFHLLVEHLIFPYYLPGADGKCCEASPCVLTLSWGSWGLGGSGSFLKSSPTQSQMCLHTRELLCDACDCCMWSRGSGLGNLILDKLYESTSWSRNIWLVTVLSRFGHEHFYLLFLVISRF